MAKFQVPQFIDQEAKIIGPLTMPQFAYIGASVGLSMIIFYALGSFLGVIFGVLCVSLGLSLAFVEINGQPLPETIKSAIFYWQKPKTYVWKRETETTSFDVSGLEKIKAVRRSMGLQKKLKSATLNITTGDFSFFKKKAGDKPKEKYQTVKYITGERRVAKRVDYKGQ